MTFLFFTNKRLQKNAVQISRYEKLEPAKYLASKNVHLLQHDQQIVGFFSFFFKITSIDMVSAGRLSMPTATDWGMWSITEWSKKNMLKESCNYSWLKLIRWQHMCRLLHVGDHLCDVTIMATHKYQNV